MTGEPLRVEARCAGLTRIRPRDWLTIRGEELVNESCSGRKLVKFGAESSTFKECRFERMRIEDAGFGGGMSMSHYVRCSFDKSRIRAPAPGCARFVECTFRDVRLTEWFC